MLNFITCLKILKAFLRILTFFFGKNSFYLEKYKQSIDWLTKYIQLKGTNGQYSKEAASLLKSAETEFVKEKSTEMQKAGEVLSVNYEIDCGPSGKVTCPVCKGDHVIVKKAAFGSEYTTCPYCNDAWTSNVRTIQSSCCAESSRKQIRLPSSALTSFDYYFFSVTINFTRLILQLIRVVWHCTIG